MEHDEAAAAEAEQLAEGPPSQTSPVEGGGSLSSEAIQLQTAQQQAALAKTAATAPSADAQSAEPTDREPIMTRSKSKVGANAKASADTGEPAAMKRRE